MPSDLREHSVKWTDELEREGNMRVLNKNDDISSHEFPLLSLPPILCPLSQIVITSQLQHRAQRLAQHKAENFALRALALELARSPRTILQKLVEQALELCGAGSAGISLLESQNGEELFRWHALAGKMAPLLNGTMPRHHSPCGYVIDRGTVQLMDMPGRHYKDIEKIGLPVCELLLAPFFCNENAIGTLWIASHQLSKKFDLEDSRIMHSLAEFAGIAWQTSRQVEELNKSRAAVAGLHEYSENSRRELSEFFTYSFIPMAILDGPLYRYTLVNQEHERILVRNALGKTIQEALPNQVYQDILPILNGVYQTGIPWVGKEIPWTSVDESQGNVQLFMNFSIHPIRNALGDITGLTAFGVDVTEQVLARNQAELSAKELQTEKQKLETMIAQSPAGIALMRGPHSIFEKVNAKWQEFVSPREYIGRTYRETYPEFLDSPLHAILRNVYDTGIPFQAKEIEARIENASIDDGIRYYDLSYIQVTDGEGKPYGIFCHALNVSDRVLARKSIEENSRKLASTVSKLEEERELRERFVAALSHDLRTPLTAAKLGAQLVLRKSGDSETVNKISRRIVTNMDRADRMIRDLLDANQIKAGEAIPLMIEECRLNPFVAGVVQELAEVHGARLQIIDTTDGVTGYWDPSALQRILENLIGNAVKYGLEGTPVTVTLTRREDWIELAVHNTGKPISLEDQITLFQPYHRTTSALGSGQKGWGIGLTLVKGIVEAHGGSARVESSLERGTTFAVRLPVDSRNVAGTH